MPTTDGSDLKELAHGLDELLADRWDDPEATYGWVCGAARSLATGEPPEVPVLAIAVSAMGTASRLDQGRHERKMVRVTMAVSCCRAVALVREVTGKVSECDGAGGSTVDLLRVWATLAPCPTCTSSGRRSQKASCGDALKKPLRVF